ncbi:MAG: hypothetical protein A2Y73_03930 [Chloroflexi bacterium RBG_13_56_8]|nr:MAG: hypothetical protein A2Y73_03930 [Chloroflexi bacterium RBG_13_56_8]
MLLGGMMDPFSHMLVTGLLIDRQPKTMLACLGPDLPWYVLYPAWLLSRRGVGKALQSGEWPLPPRWMRQMHYCTHSLLTLALGALILGPRDAEGRKLFGAWLLHILLDIPTHSRRRMATPIFWPLSRWAFDGLSWADQTAHIVATLVRGVRRTLRPVG